MVTLSLSLLICCFGSFSWIPFLILLLNFFCSLTKPNKITNLFFCCCLKMACFSWFRSSKYNERRKKVACTISAPHSIHRTRSRMRRPDSQATVPTTSSSSGERTSSSRRNNSFGTGLVSSERSIPRLYKEKAHKLSQFTLKELSHATFDFNKLLKIGEGGFGSVYKGFINNRDGIEEVLAIKRLNPYGLQVLYFCYVCLCRETSEHKRKIFTDAYYVQRFFVLLLSTI